MKTATEIYAKEVCVKCPYCGEELGDWLGSPKGEKVECEYCGKEFKVHKEADLVE